MVGAFSLRSFVIESILECLRAAIALAVLHFVQHPFIDELHSSAGRWLAAWREVGCTLPQDRDNRWLAEYILVSQVPDLRRPRSLGHLWDVLVARLALLSHRKLAKTTRQQLVNNKDRSQNKSNHTATSQ
jgi:hypothetical protein